MNPFWLALYLLQTFVLGLLLLEYLTVRFGSRAETLAVAWLAGGFLLALLFFLTSWLVAPWTPGFARGLSAAVVLAGGGFLYTRREMLFPKSAETHLEKAPFRPPVALISDVLLAVFVISMLTDSVRNPVVSVDVRAHWGSHAKLYFHTGTLMPPELNVTEFVIGHAQYPFLQQANVAFLCMLTGQFSEWAARLVPALFAIALIVFMRWGLAGLDRLCGENTGGGDASHWASPVTAMACLVPCWTLYEHGAADSGVADTTLAAFFLAAVLLALRGVLEGSTQILILSALLGAAAGLVKNEGLLLAPLFCLPLLLFAGRPRSLKAPALWSGVWLLALLPWLVARGERASFYEENYLANLIAWNWPHIARKAEPVLGQMGRYLLFMPHRFSLLGWLLVALTVRCLFRLIRERGLNPPLLILLSIWTYLAIVYLLFLVSPWFGDMQVRAAFDRILTHLGPVVGMVAIHKNISEGIISTRLHIRRHIRHNVPLGR